MSGPSCVADVLPKIQDIMREEFGKVSAKHMPIRASEVDRSLERKNNTASGSNKLAADDLSSTALSIRERLSLSRPSFTYSGTGIGKTDARQTNSRAASSASSRLLERSLADSKKAIKANQTIIDLRAEIKGLTGHIESLQLSLEDSDLKCHECYIKYKDSRIRLAKAQDLQIQQQTEINALKASLIELQNQQADLKKKLCASEACKSNYAKIIKSQSKERSKIIRPGASVNTTT
jgi:hypothetical protein